MWVYIWNKLPSAYQEVEYIESNWTQYINTWIKIQSNLLKTQAKFRITTTSQALPAWVMTNSGAYCYQLYSTGNNSIFFYWINWGDSNPITTPTNQQSIWTPNTDIEVTVTQTWALTWGAKDLDFTLFARNFNGSIEKTSMRLYYWKMFLNGTLTRDFVPCYRKSDNVIGLYDLVNNQFYTNSWSWTFTKWSDVNTYRESSLKNAYIGEYGWKPWANTIAYYKFEWDAKDYSWNSHNLTTNNVTYVTNSWISKTVAYFNWSSYWTNSQAKSEQFSQKLTPSTFICWYKAEANGWSYPNRFWLVELFDNDVSVYTRTWLITSWGSNADFKVRANRDYAFNTGVYPDVWWWWHCVVATIWEWYAKIYLDWEFKNSNTYTTADITQNTRVLISSRDTYYNYKWWIGDVIIESKVRTAQEVADYYNQTKTNYWL